MLNAAAIARKYGLSRYALRRLETYGRRRGLGYKVGKASLDAINGFIAGSNKARAMKRHSTATDAASAQPEHVESHSTLQHLPDPGSDSEPLQS